MTNLASQPILLVEDSPEDFEVTVRALAKTGFTNPVFRCADGDDALDFLHQRGKYKHQHAPRPGIILLDLNLPGTDGREVLTEVKKSTILRSIPVVVLTTSGDERDVRSSYEAGANSYVQKPATLPDLLRAVECIRSYWFSLVTLPG